MKPRVLLINSPTIRTRSVGADNYFPMGLLYLAAIIKKHKIDVKILDINNYFYTKDMNDPILNEYIESIFSKFLLDYKPDIVCIGCTFSGAFKSLKMIAQKTKEIFPKVPIIIGGIHPTIFAREILKKYSFIDYVVIGEGESTFLELIKYLTGNSESLAFTDGIAFRKKNEIKLIPKMKFEDNLDALPFIDYGLIDINEYKMDTSNWYSPKKLKVGQPFSIISSRSCPNRCTFCSMRLVHGPRIRFRSPENVLDEMESLYDNYNVRYFQFMDDNITFDRERILEICRGIKKRNMNIQFDTPNGMAINRLDKEIISAMVDAGMVCTSLGVESGSEYIRNKIMKKGLSNEKIYETVNECAKHKHLFIKGFFIIGMPEETHETLQETYEMIKKLPFDKISVNFIAPYPGTELFNCCIENNLLPNKLEQYVDMEIFQDSDECPHFKPYNLTKDDLIEFRQKCFDYMKEKRAASHLPANYPLRYNE